FSGQLAFFQQYMVGHADLSDVMEQASHHDVFQLRVLQTETQTDRTSVGGDAAAVTAGIGVTQVDKRNQCASHGQSLLAITIFHFHERVAKYLTVVDAMDSCLTHYSSP